MKRTTQTAHMYNALYINLARYVFYENEDNNKTFDDMLNDIIDKVYDMFSGDNIYFSVCSILGEGEYNIVAKININYNYYALRINKRLDNINNINILSFNTCSNLPVIILKGDNWVITKLYYNFKNVMFQLVQQHQQVIVNKLIMLYAKSMFNVIKWAHEHNMGVFDWKLSNYGLSIDDTNDNNTTKLNLILLDIDLVSIESSVSDHIAYTHNINKFNIKDKQQLDYDIVLKELYDVIYWSRNNKYFRYDRLVVSSINTQTILKYLDNIPHPINNIINSTEHEHYKQHLKLVNTSRVEPLTPQELNTIISCCFCSTADIHDDLHYKQHDPLDLIPTLRILPKAII